MPDRQSPLGIGFHLAIAVCVCGSIFVLATTAVFAIHREAIRTPLSFFVLALAAAAQIGATIFIARALKAAAITSRVEMLLHQEPAPADGRAPGRTLSREPTRTGKGAETGSSVTVINAPAPLIVDDVPPSRAPADIELTATPVPSRKGGKKT